jgi:hypothetical protein
MIRWNGKRYIPAGVKPLMGARRGAPVPGNKKARWVASWVGGVDSVPPTPPVPPPCDFDYNLVITYHILAQDGDELITQSGDNIDFYPL